MAVDYLNFFSEDTFAFYPSPVREIFKKVDLDKIYSFAGGYPSADTFPLEDIAQLSQKVLHKYGAKCLQYGATQGLTELREALAKRFSQDIKNIQITTSSQQGIDICSRIMLDPDDVVLCTNPSYLGALQSFKSYRAEIVGVDYYRQDELFEKEWSKTLLRLIKENKKVKFLYIIPDFQNPTGESLSLGQRQILLTLAKQYNFLIVEDSPYRELYYEEKCAALPTLYSLDSQRVIHLGSFSKIFAPGFRLAWIFAEEAILEKIYQCKQALDLCPPIFDQYITAEYINSSLLDKNLERNRLLYKDKRDFILHLLSKYMPETVTWVYPKGGLFLFLYLPEMFDSLNFYDISLKKGVAYVAGTFFYTDGKGRNTMRLNFSYMSKEKMEKGIILLSSLIKEYLQQ